MKRLLIFLFSILPFILVAQSGIIYPGEKKIVSPTDTSYIITKNQMRQCIISDKNYHLEQEKTKLLKKKVTIISARKAELEQLVKINKKDALFYRKHWEEAEKDVNIVAKEAKRQKRMKLLYGGVGIVIGILINLL